MSAAPVDRLRSLLAPVVASIGLDLDSVDVTQAGRRRVVRVAVDKDGGVSLDDIAVASREVSATLDASDALGDAPYVLEVSSPGVDRPLTEPKHWRRAVGRLVAVEAKGGVNVTGRVEAADADGVDLDVDGHDRRLEFADVVRARVQVEFARKEPNRDAGRDEEG